MERITVSITTNAAGAGTGYAASVRGMNRGNVKAIRYVKTDYAAGVDFVITGETSGMAILTGTDVNASATFFPRAATCDIVGAASLYAAAGEPVEVEIPIADEQIKIVVAAGGDTKTGTFHIWIG